MLDALSIWAEEPETDALDPQWHTHISDADGNELAIAIEPGET